MKIDVSTDGTSFCEDKVADLGEYRLARGKKVGGGCFHKQLRYESEIGVVTRVWCSDCGDRLELSEALFVLANHFQSMNDRIKRGMAEVEDAKSATLVRRAAKSIDRAWNGRLAPICPHCRGGLLPEDFDENVPSATSVEVERARRRRGKKA